MLPRVVSAHVGAGRVVCVFVRDGCFFSDEVVECHCLEPGCGRHGAVHKATGRIAAALRWWRQPLIYLLIERHSGKFTIAQFFDPWVPVIVAVYQRA